MREKCGKSDKKEGREKGRGDREKGSRRGKRRGWEALIAGVRACIWIKTRGATLEIESAGMRRETKKEEDWKKTEKGEREQGRWGKNKEREWGEGKKGW